MVVTPPHAPESLKYQLTFVRDRRGQGAPTIYLLNKSTGELHYLSATADVWVEIAKPPIGRSKK
jgi:hypothetical protein